MPINEQHLLGLLADILKNHHSQQYLSNDEKRQLQQLCNQLLQLGMTDEQLIETLQAIEHNDFQNEQNIDQWLAVIDQNLLS